MGKTSLTSDTNHPVIKRLSASGPKRILALDGGGIRGALTIGFLEKIEAELGERHQATHPDFRLSDYYDMIGGTSTGAIIATCLAKGMKISEVKKLYLELGKNIFSSWKKRIPSWLSWVKKGIDGIEILCASAHFSEKNLEDSLKKEFGDIQLGSKEFKTGLLIVAKRADTYSPWFFHNHPQSKYYKENSGIFIKDLLRATSAAPSYFPPKDINVGDNSIGVFIDGGVSAHNNPALIMFYMTTLSHLPYMWVTGKDNLLITSLGTGFAKLTKNTKVLLKKKIFQWASDIPDLFMSDATSVNQLVLQSLGFTQMPQTIDSEFKDLAGINIVNEPLFTYQRYNVPLTRNDLRGIMGIEYTDAKIAHLVEMSNGDNAQELYDIGSEFATSNVKSIHFSQSFDLLYGHERESIIRQNDKGVITPWIKSNGKLYKKFKTVHARKAIEGETVISTTTSGVETSNTAKASDYVVKNQTSANEMYIVSAEKFEQRYQHCIKVDTEWDEYIPIGMVYAIQLDPAILKSKSWPQHFYIDAPWESLQYCTISDYLVCPPDESEFYRIGRQEFEQTYTLNNKP